MNRSVAVLAFLFWSIRRNRFLSIGLCALGLVFMVSIHHFMHAMVHEDVINARTEDVSRLAVRNLMPVYVVMTMLGLHVVGSDRRAGTLGWRVSLIGNASIVHRAVWLLGALVGTGVALVFTAIGGFYERLVWGQSSALTADAAARDLLLLFLALLYYFAWGVLVSTFTSQPWMQIALGFLVPWVALPVIRASLVMAAPRVWTNSHRLVPFESALSLGSWAGSANPLTEEDGRFPILQLISCLLLLALSVYASRRRLLAGCIDE